MYKPQPPSLLTRAKLLLSTVLTVSALLGPVGTASAEEPLSYRDYVTRVFRRLTGRLPTSQERTTMTNLVLKKDLLGAAEVAVNTDDFYNTNLVKFAAPLSSRSDESRTPLNDFVAMLVGTTRDDRDFREILSGDFTYVANSSHPDYVCRDRNCGFDFNNPKPHFDYLHRYRVNLRKFLTRVSPQWPQIRNSDSAGVLTSDTWARTHLSAGTNRRSVEFTFKIFLCTPISALMDTNLPSDYYNRIGRDVDRSPGGDPAVFNNQCRGCHAVMDPLRGAFAYFDMPTEGVDVPQKSGVVAKMNRNASVYPNGFVTTDNSWINFTTQNQNSSLGWRGAMRGRGVREFGQMMANSMAFSSCMATRVWRHVCNSEPSSVDQKLAATLAQSFESDGYRMRELFKKVATHPSCIGSVGSKSIIKTPIQLVAPIEGAAEEDL